MGNKSLSTAGFILADVLAALVIAAIALSTILTGVIHGARLVSIQTERILKVIERENEKVSKAEQIFTVGE